VAETATGIVLIAGTITFGNEWYQTGKVNWKIPIATMLAAAVFDGLAKLDDKAAIGLSVIVLLGAFTTKFGGKSVAQTVTDIFTQVNKPETPKSTVKRAA
jgi:hypothetical protein